MNEPVCHCHCIHLSGGTVVSMAATSWQQCANDDEGSLHDGFSRSLQSCCTQREKGGGKRSDTGIKVLIIIIIIICEVNLNLNYLMYHGKEILSEVESSEQKQI